MKANNKIISSFILLLFLAVLSPRTILSQNSNDTVQDGNASTVSSNSNMIKNVVSDSIREQQLELLSNINCDLSNAWAINLKVNGADEEGYKSRAIKSFLFTYKTKKDGRNSGVILNLYDIRFKDSVLKDKKPTHSSIVVHFLYTKNYIVYINHGKRVNDIYDGYMPLLMDELKTFFKTNKDLL